LWTPNKALGLTGVRAAYAIAPLHADAAVQSLQALAPSWPVGAHGVAMLHNWVQADTQAWLAQSRSQLQVWKQRQMAALKDLGWDCLPSLANFFCARAPADVDLPTLREAGIKLRDAASLGLPGYFRLAVLPPSAQDALFAQLRPNVQAGQA
jgi:histidinol-phosphate aminotransferase